MSNKRPKWFGKGLTEWPPHSEAELSHVPDRLTDTVHISNNRLHLMHLIQSNNNKKSFYYRIFHWLFLSDFSQCTIVRNLKLDVFTDGVDAHPVGEYQRRPPTTSKSLMFTVAVLLTTHWCSAIGHKAFRFTAPTARYSVLQNIICWLVQTHLWLVMFPTFLHQRLWLKLAWICVLYRFCSSACDGL